MAFEKSKWHCNRLTFSGHPGFWVDFEDLLDEPQPLKVPQDPSRLRCDTLAVGLRDLEHWHGQVVSIPDGARASANSEHHMTFKTGWWFGTFLIFPEIWNNHPSWVIFFRGVETSNQNISWTVHPGRRLTVLSFTSQLILFQAYTAPNGANVATKPEMKKSPLNPWG